ncbi:LysR family transcriptional regulator [Raoultibacter phocaeensis]|uniref:LysR family transcriptional regulator n=1 Tax=Raoultibacter phocaeensis TaxID=2479841 RepID=UPI0015D57030|nr:LysR family transcriptional regulator [Raoultibacter phocaeensis]
MRLETLHEFVIVAKHLNITKAAQELYISQPSLSARMSALEKELGYPLLDRTRQKLSLTPAGSVLLDYAQRIIGLYAEALAESEAAAKNRPTIKAATLAPDSPFYAALPNRESHPYTFVDLDLNTTATDALRKGLVDVAIDSDYSCIEELREESETLGITYRRLGTDRCFLAMMASHPLAHRDQLSRHDLEGQTIVINSGSHFDRWSKMVQTMIGPDIKVGFRMNTLESTSNLAFVDLGSSIYICGGGSSRAYLDQRSDVVILDKFGTCDLAYPIALVCRTADAENETSPVKEFVDEFLNRALDAC